MIHSRFATNTNPNWNLTQPFRFLAHNGEINTVQGNLNWLRSGEKNLESPYFSQQRNGYAFAFNKTQSIRFIIFR